MVNLNSLMIGTENSEVLAAFYEKVLGKKPDMHDGEWYGFQCGSCFFGIGNHDKVKGKNANPERILFNFETTDVPGEFERIKAAGATVIKEPYHMDPNDTKNWIATFADPDGNYFQLMSPWE